MTNNFDPNADQLGSSPPFSKFSDSYNALAALLDKIKATAPQGAPTPPQAGAEPGTTDTGAKAYGDAHGKANDLVKAVVTTLSDSDVSFFSGLNFTDPTDVTKQRTDVTNSALAAWDAPAAKYMKNAIADGDALRPKLQARLQEFDAAVTSEGITPVTPDQ